MSEDNELRELVFDAVGNCPDYIAAELIAKAEGYREMGYPDGAIAEIFELYDLLRSAIGALLTAQAYSVDVPPAMMKEVDHYEFTVDELPPASGVRQIRLSRYHDIPLN